MKCSTTKTYILISSAVTMLGTAVALAYIFLNWVGLIFAIGLAATVSFVMIPQIRHAIREYSDCRGPSQGCDVSSSINSLGQAAALVSIVSWTIAVALEIPALAALASIFFSWIGATLAAVAAGLRLTGAIGAAACAAVLVGVATNFASYVACRDSEAPGGGGGPIG